MHFSNLSDRQIGRISAVIEVLNSKVIHLQESVFILLMLPVQNCHRVLFNLIVFMEN